MEKENFYSGRITPQDKEKLYNLETLPNYEDTAVLDYAQKTDFHLHTKEHEILNKEFISKLTDHLVELVRHELTDSNKVRLLEICAGSGRLLHFLKKELLARLPDKDVEKIIFKAVDDQSGSLNIKPVYEVEKEEFGKTYDEFQPDIVIVSWPGSTGGFRNWFETPASTKAIVVIGPGDVCVGGDYEEPDGWMKIEGFDKKELLDVETVQVSKDPHSKVILYIKNQ